MKRTLFALLPLLALAGCSSQSTTDNTTTSAAPATDFKVGLLTPGDVNDQGWNQLAAEGLKGVETKLGAQTSQQVTKNASDYAPAMRDYGDQGYKLVFCHGYEYGNTAKTIGPSFTNTKYVVVSGDVNVAPNVASISPRLEEATYLCGMAAAGISKSGVVGLIGGGEFPVIQSTFDAFTQGAKQINPKTKVLTGYVGNFEDQNKGKEIARSQISQGADVLFHNADQAGKGMFVAAQESTKSSKTVYVFGSNRNQNEVAPDVTIASAVIEMPTAFEDIAKSVQDGTFKPQYIELNMPNKSIALEWNEALKSKVPAAVLTKIDTAQKDIMSGKLKLRRKL